MRIGDRVVVINPETVDINRGINKGDKGTIAGCHPIRGLVWVKFDKDGIKPLDGKDLYYSKEMNAVGLATGQLEALRESKELTVKMTEAEFADWIKEICRFINIDLLTIGDCKYLRDMAVSNENTSREIATMLCLRLNKEISRSKIKFYEDKLDDFIERTTLYNRKKQV